MDGKVSARKAGPGWQTERKFVQPYQGKSPHSLDYRAAGEFARKFAQP